MPRLLPRLLQKIAQEKDAAKYSPLKKPQRVVSEYQRLPPRLSLQPSHYPRSILFSPEPNPATTPRRYDVHKSLPPLQRRPPQATLSSAKYNHDAPREMSDEERAWWSSPYLRMLASPVRRCFVADRHLPSDFLIRLGAVRLPETSKSTLVPDGLQHTKFAARRSPRAVYVSCHRRAVLELVNRRDLGRVARNIALYPHLPEHVADMLRARVLQELELHCDQLPFKSRGRPENASCTPSIRRLTRREWQAIKDTGLVPYSNAVALIVVPPLNKDPSTGKRPAPSMFSEPPTSEAPPAHLNPLPICELLPLSDEVMLPYDETLSSANRLPRARVPLYNGVAMFPDPAQRSYLHSQLCRALAWESRKRSSSQKEGKDFSNDKSSHTFLLSSDQDIMKFGDITAVAIALWRVRIYEGGGWDYENTWAFDPPKYKWRSERYRTGSDTVQSAP